MSYNKLLAYLEALPEHERQFIRWKYVKEDTTCGCVLGKALSPSLRDELLDSVVNNASILVERAGEVLQYLNTHFDLTPDEASTVQWVNDHFEGTPDERYCYMIAWLHDKILNA